MLFEISSVKKERYDWIRHELIRFNYLQRGKIDKGIVIRYLMKVSGYSRQQVTRLIAHNRKTGYIKYHHANVPAFQRRYSKEDIRLLAKMDQRYDDPCGHTLKKLCERAYSVFNEEPFVRLSTISVSHLYNLRKTKTYRLTRQSFTRPRLKHQPSARGVNPDLTGNRAIFVLIPCIRVIWISKRAFIISMPWMKKLNLKWSQVWRK